MYVAKALARLLTVALFSLPVAPAVAAEAGKDYLLITPVQPTESRGRIEVIEFFAYTCPHCFELEPSLNAWARTLPRDVVLKRQPVVFSPTWEPMARAYFALEALGLVEELHADVFNALHVEDRKLTDPNAFFDWAARKGVDKAKLKDAYNSFSVGTKVAQARQIARRYRINGVPALAVNGRYLTSASQTGSYERTLQVVDELIDSERKRRR